ncbi:MAG: S8 family serine peptidase, partial [Flavobacteriales bacterium]
EINGSTGVDDDGNGFIDDKYGWDAQNSDATISDDMHGTHVSGTVGAKGDNSKGFVGVNWGLEILPIQGSSQNEAIVVEAYDYVLEMRRLYDSTDGDKGAFIVSTNSSFGVDEADPSNYPLWCGMYDSLGAHGITSAVAGPNSDIDIDVKGDVPGACPSDHTLSVTNTDWNDKRATAGYGDVNVDLGAPGTDILSTTPDNNYSELDGTSMATPHVAGAVALLYSAPCPKLTQLNKVNPDSASLLAKNYIMKGVDQVADLQNETVTEGRLNIHKSLQILMNDCDTSDCPQPFGLTETNVLDSAITVTYINDSANKFVIKYKEKGGMWDSLSTNDDTVTINGLKPCTSYYIKVIGHCDSLVSYPSDSLNIKTRGCCLKPKNTEIIKRMGDSAQIKWKKRFIAKSYELRYRDTSITTWNTVTGIDTNFITMEFDSCKYYEVQVRVECDTGFTDYTSGFVFRTKGCGACIDKEYCPSKGDDASFEWIERVQLNTLDNNSGTDNGYGNYEIKGTRLVANETYTITLTPGFDNFEFDEYFKVFIDYNLDGDFSDTLELAYDGDSIVSSTVSGSITIPSDINRGETRMRVSMKNNNPPSSCEDPFPYGEVEDYCVQLCKTNKCNTGVNDDNERHQSPFRIYPNPTQNFLNIEIDKHRSLKSVEVKLIGVAGKVLKRKRIASKRNTLNIEGLVPGLYMLIIEMNGKIYRKKVMKK